MAKQTKASRARREVVQSERNGPKATAARGHGDREAPPNSLVDAARSRPSSTTPSWPLQIELVKLQEWIRHKA
jgi:hypothetical protein